MRVLLAITILGINLVPLRADDAGNRTTTPVADALDWYSVWFASNPDPMPGAQTCRGELRGARTASDAIHFRWLWRWWSTKEAIVRSLL